MVTAVDNSYRWINGSNNADLDHPAIQTTNAARTRVVLYISTDLSLSNSRRVSDCPFDDDLAVARYALVLEDAIGCASPATVCCYMDGASKPFRMDIQAARESCLLVSSRH